MPEFSEFQSGWGSLIGLGFVCLIVGGILITGLSAIEKFAKLLMPLLLLTILGLAAYGLVLGDTGAAINFLFSFSPSDLANPGLWAAAVGQAFYSLAIGQGYLITYGSYMPRGIHMVRAVGFVAIFNVGVALLAGLMIFTLVFEQGLDLAAGSALAFEVMPEAFRAMPAGTLVAALFFWLFFLAALSSAIAGAKVVTVPISEHFPVSANSAVVVGVGLVAILGVPSALSYAAPQWSIAGQPVLDVIDKFAGSGAVIATAVGGAAIAGWALTVRRWEGVMERTPARLTSVLVFIARWVCLPVGAISGGARSSAARYKIPQRCLR
ncbi:sodium-dependent transporter [Devosia pacifica]|uniref:sodium-dependent transporter n=1 Tax=Devosia pacifica TaxID=1335967 RepID=UPI0016747C15|nr:sodium-dependent transporter [Devosia pacifica]